MMDDKRFVCVFRYKIVNTLRNPENRDCGRNIKLCYVKRKQESKGDDDITWYESFKSPVCI